ncbi:MAG: flavin reductase [Nocardioidaceae bacterium]|nr:flavin reductase [Nocardioidaceae bacterium]
MTIHTDHPFTSGDRDPVRRFRGRAPAPVGLWTAGSGRDRVGLTVSSFLVADGEPSRVLGLVDEDSAFWDEEPTVFVVHLLAPGQEYLADVFAGTAPSPGGTFTQGTWSDSPWGPVLEGTAGHLGVRRVPQPPRHVGWGLLVEGVVEDASVTDADALVHVRGRYR